MCTPHPTTAAPISGSTDPCEVTFEHSNTVRRLGGPPRVTLPYSDEQWARIDTLGDEVDKALSAGDVRLTLGGEPTFVAVDDMEADEWTTAADGADKRARAEALARRLLERFAPGGLVHYGQGKWYPGEPLPRWQIAVLWRTDGAACGTTDPSLHTTCSQVRNRPTRARRRRGNVGARDRGPPRAARRLLRPGLRGPARSPPRGSPTAGRRPAGS